MQLLAASLLITLSTFTAFNFQETTEDASEFTLPTGWEWELEPRSIYPESQDFHALCETGSIFTYWSDDSFKGQFVDGACCVDYEFGPYCHDVYDAWWNIYACTSVGGIYQGDNTLCNWAESIPECD